MQVTNHFYVGSSIALHNETHAWYSYQVKDLRLDKSWVLDNVFDHLCERIFSFVRTLQKKLKSIME